MGLHCIYYLQYALQWQLTTFCLGLKFAYAHETWLEGKGKT
jgi:hypothetical protein